MKKNKGIKVRIYRLTTAIAASAILLFTLIGMVELLSFWSIIQKNNDEQNASISDIMSKTTQTQAQGQFLREIIAAAKLTDGELWTVIHDSTMLAEEAEAILRADSRYNEVDIQPPSMDNAGKLALQLVFASYADPNDQEALAKARKLANLKGIMEGIMEGSTAIHDIVISTPEGISVVMDDYSETKIGKDGEVLYYDLARRPFYAGVMEKGGLYITPLNDDNYDDSRQICVGVPVYVDGKLEAIVGCSIDVGNVGEIAAESKMGESMSTCLVSNLGSIVYSDNEDGELGIRRGEIHNLYDTANEELAEVLEDVLDGNNGCKLITLDGEEVYLAYAPIATVGWGQFFFVPKKTLDQTTDRLVEETDVIFDETQHDIAVVTGVGILVAFVTWAVLMVVVSLVTKRIANRLAQPIVELNSAGRRFIDRETQDLTPAPLFFGKVEVDTEDEIEELWYTLMDMEINIAVSMRRISKMASREERIAAELSLAANIQTDMLPTDFLPCPDRADAIDLYAMMFPAKEVGGDFYDFFMVDDTHLAIVMADVSGKGVPAAMFMMMAKLYINSYAMAGGKPKDVLFNVNNAVCAHNKEGLFVTVWLGILDLDTGVIEAANAGHEFPIIKRGDGQYCLFEDPHGFVIGGLEGQEYEDYTIRLEKGDIIFLYTDGVPEAQTRDGDMFGEERILDALNETRAGSCMQEILEHTHESVNGFVGDGPQFDDLTMLALRYNG